MAFLPLNFIRRTELQIYDKLSYEAQSRHFWVGAVTGWRSCRLCLATIVHIKFRCQFAFVLAGGIAFLKILEGKEILKNNFSLVGRRGESSFAIFGLVLTCANCKCVYFCGMFFCLLKSFLYLVCF